MSTQLEMADMTAENYCKFYSSAVSKMNIDGADQVMERWILNYADAFDYSPRPDWCERRTPQECFRNAFLLAGEDRGIELGLVYCEGFVLSSDIPILIHHGWCVTPDGQVIDPTLPQAGDEGVGTMPGRVSAIPMNTTYFGVKLPDYKALCKLAVERRIYGVLYSEPGHALIEATCAKTSGNSDG